MKPTRRAAEYTWTPHREYRDICACQRQARRERGLWRRAVRSVKRRGAMLLVTVPLAFGAIGMEAINVSFPAIAQRAIDMSSGSRPFPIFATRKFRSALLSPERAVNSFSLAAAKEEFFRTQVPYGTIIYREALKNDLAPELVAAVVESESDFRPRLVSGKNARGLMQIIPETGRLMGCDDAFNPRSNVAAGTRYLRYLVNRFGDERIALAAYNAGEGKVERLGGIPQYRETLDYVSRVGVRTKQYRQRVQSRYIAAVRLQSSIIER